MEFSFNHIWVKMIFLFCGYWILQSLPTRNEVVFHCKAGQAKPAWRNSLYQLKSLSLFFNDVFLDCFCLLVFKLFILYRGIAD